MATVDFVDRPSHYKQLGAGVSFAESFAGLLSDHNIVVEPATLPDRETIGRSLQQIQTWFDEADQAVRDGFDEGSAEFAVCLFLADPEVDVAPDIPSVLEAFDQVAGQRLSELVRIAQDCLVRATDDE